jgi:hypothetical protein
MRAIFLLLALAPAARADGNFAVETMTKKARLDHATAEKVQAIVEQYRGKIDPIRHEDRELVRSLRGQLAGKTDDKTLVKLSKQLIHNRAKLQELRSERLSTLEKALPAPAFARLLLAMPSIDRAVFRHSVQQQRGSDS